MLLSCAVKRLNQKAEEAMILEQHLFDFRSKEFSHFGYCESKRGIRNPVEIFLLHLNYHFTNQTLSVLSPRSLATSTIL